MEPIDTVRNATQAAKQFASSSAGRLARIEVMVTASCLLVGILVLCNSRRRHESRGFPRLVVWAAFMFNYPVISYTIGQMQSSSIENELFVVWACYLLLLLGSADTMTAFSFNDSNQQTRSMMNQGLHIIYLLLLILYYKGQLRYSFIVSLFLLWALSVVRLGLRAWAYRSTCRSRGLVRENQIIYEYMHDNIIHSFAILRERKHDPKTMKGYTYLVDGKEMEKVVNGKRVVGVQWLMETVDIERVWQCKGKLLGSRDRGASRRRDLCLSFALFRLLRLRFAVDLVGNINFYILKRTFKELVIDGLLSEQEDLDRAFRVVEAELGFLFDFFYTRYPSIKTTLAPDLVVYSAILATSIFTLLSLDLVSSKRYRPAKAAGTSIFIHGFNLDLLITHLVILSYIFIESYQFIACFIFSDWHKVKMLCWYVRNDSWQNTPLVEIPLKVLCHFTSKKYWKGTIGQYFLLNNTHPHKLKSFLSWISLQSLDESLMTSSIRLGSDVRHAVLYELKDCKGEITDGRMWLYSMGVIDLDLDYQCFTWETYACNIVTWHVATSICSYGLNLESNASPELVKNHGIATKLSGYCMYLLAFQPELVPDTTYGSLSVASGTLQNAREFLAECKSDTDKYEKLMDLGRKGETDHDVRYLSKGAQLAVHLLEKSRIRNNEGRWEMLASFWANMMLYIAPSDRAVAHATKMATGGEFITIIWALLTNAHVVDKLQQDPRGAEGLRDLLVQEKDGSLEEDSGHASVEGGSLDNC